MRGKSCGRMPLAVGAVGAAALLVAVLGFGVSTGLAQLGEPAFGSGEKRPIRVIPDSAAMPQPSTQPSAPIAPREPENLLPEYARLVDREGAVVRKAIGPEGGLRTVFRSADEKLELVLLENRYLEALENNTDYGRKSAKLRVSGTVMVYRGINYLLLTRVQIKQP